MRDAVRDLAGHVLGEAERQGRQDGVRLIYDVRA